MNLEIKATLYFAKRIKKLNKKYRQIIEDLETLKDVLLKDPSAGDAIPGLHGKVYKIRIPSSDTKKGKSGGFRVIYYYIYSDASIYLLDIYTKSSGESMPINDIIKILKDNDLNV